MALIQFGALVTQARGSVGGHTFDISKGGATLRKKRSNVRCDSPLQMVAKNQLLAVASAWRGLTASQVLGWNVGASVFPNHNRFGQVTKLSGMALFIKLNSNILLTGNPINLNLPVIRGNFPVTFTTVTSNYALSELILVWFCHSPFNPTILIKASPPQNVGVAFNKSNLRIIANPFNSSGNWNIFAPYLNTFGYQFMIGQYIWSSITAIDGNSGVSSGNTIFQVLIT